MNYQFLNYKTMNFSLLNHRAKVAELAHVIANRATNGKPMYAIDASRWGISEPFSDPENFTLYRKTLFELANDTFVSEEEEMDCRHYPNAPYESIFDY